MRISTVLIGLFLCLCACKRIEKHAPAIIPVEGNLTPIASTINLPIVIAIQDIEDLVNEKLKGELYNDNSFDKDNLKISVSKIGRIDVSMTDNRLYYRVPLHIWMELQMDQKKLISKVKKTQQLDFSLVLHFQSSLAIDANWRPVVHTKLLQYEWVKEPAIKIAFMNLPITKVVEKQLDMRIDGLLSKIDASVHQKLDVKTPAKKLWTSLQKPILVHKNHGKVWLHAKPNTLAMNRINSKDGHLLIHLTLTANFETLLGENPQMPVVEELPKLLSSNDTSSSFKISILSKIPFDQLNNALNEAVPKKEVKIDEYTVKMKAFEMAGSDSAVLMRVDVGGAMHGKLYFRGKPSYDSASKVFTLKDFAFDVSSEEILVNTADWLLHGSLHEKIQEHLHVPVGEKLEALPELIQKAIDNSKMSKKVSIKIKNMKINLQDMLVTTGNVQVQVGAVGDLSLEVEKLAQ